MAISEVLHESRQSLKVRAEVPAPRGNNVRLVDDDRGEVTAVLTLGPPRGGLTEQVERISKRHFRRHQQYRDITHTERLESLVSHGRLHATNEGP